uniref:APC membrane recruitment protein 1 n=1 Tax=Cyprinodon variegatus TaxID=28743 RepID=A0A3Q2E2M2_CYPVA
NSQQFRCGTGPDGVTEELQPDPVNEAGKSPKAGKFRTALTFFSVRKGICILPSFFGGRNKNQNKWSSKRGIGKSRTHDGLSKVSDDGALGECSHPTPDQKSLTLGRQRKSFRSLFQSFRHHRKVPVQHDPRCSATECLESEPDVPESVEDLRDISMGLECSRVDSKAPESGVEKESPKSEPLLCDDKHEDSQFKVVTSGVYDNTSRRSSEPCLKLQTGSETPTGSSDQLNLMFGEVSSLKSFDSLTGCGDIIADQEDDSITESTVSGERSRNGGKRASCYLTYQGGGEEMASPEDLDATCLQEIWGSSTSEAVHCGCDPDQTQTELTSSHNVDVLNSSSSTQHPGAMDTSSIADVLTPQSEHQESGPNSDEGYYDSTTPGPDEGQEKRSGRLPRDSYSGDALYELFAPDESLISPHYESKSQIPSLKHGEYLAEPIDGTDSVFVPEMSHLGINADLYKEDFREVSSPFSKNQDIRGNENYPDFETFCEPKEDHLEENKPVALPYKNISSQAEESSSYMEDGQTVCFSQALVDYTKRTQMLGKLSGEVDDLERSATFTPNMDALPTIVTFDVVDLHNEGEYDEQIHMELEEDGSSSYQEFNESYLQKDAYAECDYQMFDLYERSVISNNWAVASLPRHLSAPRVNASVSNSLSLDRRSRSLDTDNLESNTPETYRENRPAMASEQDSERSCSPYYRKNVVLSTPEVRDGNNMTSSWQTRSEVTAPDGKITENVQSLSRTQVNHKQPQYFCSMSDGLSCDLVSENKECYSRQRHPPLRSDSCLPHSTFGTKEEDVCQRMVEAEP